MKFEFLDFEICDKVATITLNRPDVLNAIHPPMANELSQAWKQVRDDEDIWMAVLDLYSSCKPYASLLHQWLQCRAVYAVSRPRA